MPWCGFKKNNTIFTVFWISWSIWVSIQCSVAKPHLAWSISCIWHSHSLSFLHLASRTLFPPPTSMVTCLQSPLLVRLHFPDLLNVVCPRTQSLDLFSFLSSLIFLVIISMPSILGCYLYTWEQQIQQLFDISTWMVKKHLNIRYALLLEPLLPGRFAQLYPILVPIFVRFSFILYSSDF